MSYHSNYHAVFHSCKVVSTDRFEEPDAIDLAEEIIEVEGIDGLMLGPADFSVLSGIPGEVHHDLVLEASRKIAVAAANAGKHWGRTSSSFEHTKEYMDMGARLIFQGSDIMALKSALLKLQKDAAPLGFTFDNIYA